MGEAIFSFQHNMWGCVSYNIFKIKTPLLIGCSVLPLWPEQPWKSWVVYTMRSSSPNYQATLQWSQLSTATAIKERYEQLNQVINKGHCLLHVEKRIIKIGPEMSICWIFFVTRCRILPQCHIIAVVTWTAYCMCSVVHEWSVYQDDPAKKTIPLI